MNSSQATHADAELILKLYDLRREAVMREARNFVFQLTLYSIDDLMSVASAQGQKESAYLRQVYGYWDMVAALVAHGTLNALLVYDTCHEMYFVYAKIQPFLKEFRQKMGMPEFLVSLEKFVESSAEGRERVARLQKLQAEWGRMRVEAAKQSA